MFTTQSLSVHRFYFAVPALSRGARGRCRLADVQLLYPVLCCDLIICFFIPSHADVCIPLKPLSVLLEYMPFGDLDSFLRRYHSNDPALHPYLMSNANSELVHGRCTASLRHGSISDQSFSGDVRTMEWLTSLPVTAATKLATSHLLRMASDACEAMLYVSENYYVHR